MNLIERYQSLADQRNWNEALIAIDEIIGASPAIGTSRFNRGVCLDELGRYGEAAESFIKAQEGDTEDLGIHYRIIRSLFLAENFPLLFEFLDYSSGINSEVLDLIEDDDALKRIAERPEFLTLKATHGK